MDNIYIFVRLQLNNILDIYITIYGEIKTKINLPSQTNLVFTNQSRFANESRFPNESHFPNESRLSNKSIRTGLF